MSYLSVKAFFVLALLLLVSSPIEAQTHPCGGGPGPREVQVGEAPGGNGVAPMPICNWVNGNQSPGAQQPPMHWADQWGAIATDKQLGKIGASTNESNKSEAESTALNQCQSSGGTQCKVLVSFYNQCGVMVLGDGVVNGSSAATISQASEGGLKVCSAVASNCHVYYSTCSLPKLIQ